MNRPSKISRSLSRVLPRVILAIAAAFCAAAPTVSATLIHAQLDWTGDLGYQVSAQFTYNNKFAMITPGSGLHDLSVGVRDPAGTLLQDTVNFGPDGGYPYLYFSFNPTTQRLVGFLDIGDDSGYFLQGPQAFQLFLSTSTDDGSLWIPIDHGGSYSVRTVPDDGFTLLLFTIALGGCVAARRALASDRVL